MQNHAPATGLEIFSSCFSQFQIPLRSARSAWMTHTPFAFWIMEAMRPRMLVELGAHTGVSFCAFCQQAVRQNATAMCYAVDTWKGDQHSALYSEDIFEDLCHYVHQHYASFAHLIRSTFDDALPLFGENSIDLLHIDGFHSHEAMMHDFESWLPKMSERGVILMHDINARLPGYGGPQVWEAIAARFPSFTFEHGFGLGVVLVGCKPPDPLCMLAECGKDPACAENVRRYFMQLGALQQNIHDLTQNTRDLRHLLEQEQHTATQCRRDFEHRLAETEHRANFLLGQFARSRSWRITKPLRRAVQGWRRLRGLPCCPEPQGHFPPADEAARS